VLLFLTNANQSEKWFDNQPVGSLLGVVSMGQKALKKYLKAGFR